MKVPAAFLLVFSLFDLHVFGSQSSSQHATSDWFLKFEDFSAGRFFKGRPARPVFLTEEDRTFRTMIRRAARKGPNFAGHFAIAHWGRGSGLTSFVVLDVATGRVYDERPFDFIDVPFQGASSGRDYEGLVYKPGSRLLIADGCPENGKCGTYYYEWKNSSFTLLRFDPLGPSTR
jgi:hypothetical protein